LVPVVLFLPTDQGVELVKALRLRAAIFDRSPSIKGTIKICFGLTAAVFLLQSYWVRELLFMETVVAVGFVIVALIGAVFALGYIAALWLGRLGSGLKAFGALVSVRHRQPFAETTTICLSETKEEVS
jgi:apolipoprotein N-acyltransferase